MRINKPLISGMIFFLFALSVISFSGIKFNLFPTQEVDLSNNADFGQVLPGNVFIQEITMKKDYLAQIDLYIGRINNDGINETVMLIVDESRQILFSRRFSSREIVKADYYPFKLKKPIEIGKGKKVLVCLSSVDGSPANYITIPLNKKSAFGVFSVARIQNDDLISTISNPKEITHLEGSIGVKTHETNHPLFTFSFFLFLIVAVIITTIIIFIKQIKQLLLPLRLYPEYAFLVIATVFGAIFLYITPPFQTPDEPAHFYRSYQISELNFSSKPYEAPKSLQTITAPGERMKFKSWEKTSKAEILALANVKLESGVRSQVEALSFTIPYLPQALGIAVSRIFTDSPIWFLYASRLFNLLAAIGLVFLAIKITPVQKWLFFLLGVMPMTVSQMASASYDASTISLSFLLFAFILRLAFSQQSTIPRKALFILFLLTLLLSFCKLPYFLILLVFLIIPVSKIGSIKRFAIIFAGLLLSAILVSQFWSSAIGALQSLFISNAHAMTFTPNPAEITDLNLTPILSDKEPGTSQTETKTVGGASDQKPQPNQAPSGNQQIANTSPPPPAESPFNATAQKKFIFDNPVRFLGILVNSITKYFGLYMTSFVGLFGFNDTGLPDSIVYLFITILLLVALINPASTIRIGIARKFILLTIFISSVLLIETGLYLYSNIVGVPYIVGVQGRYFIPLAPLFFILFYQQAVTGYFDKTVTKAPVKPIKGKAATAMSKPSGIQNVSVFQSHLLPWVIISFALFTLTYSIIMIINRFYIVTC